MNAGYNRKIGVFSNRRSRKKDKADKNRILN